MGSIMLLEIGGVLELLLSSERDNGLTILGEGPRAHHAALNNPLIRPCREGIEVAPVNSHRSS